MTKFPPARERQEEKGRLPPALPEGLRAALARWAGHVAAFFQKSRAGSAHPPDQVDKPARVQPPPEASLKGAGEPGGRIRGRRRGGVPPLNSLKCVGERGKDESFSSQRRDPAKGARGRATRLLGSLRAGRKREGFLHRWPRRCFASWLFLAKWLPEPAMGKWEARPTPLARPPGCGDVGPRCWGPRLLGGNGVPRGVHLQEGGEWTPDPGGLLWAREQRGRGCREGSQGKMQQNFPLCCLSAAPLAVGGEQGYGRATGFTLSPSG